MVLLFVSGYLFSRALHTWSLCLSSSDSLLRPPGALIVAVSPAKRKRKPELDSGNSNRCI